MCMNSFIWVSLTWEISSPSSFSVVYFQFGYNANPDKYETFDDLTSDSGTDNFLFKCEKNVYNHFEQGDWWRGNKNWNETRWDIELTESDKWQTSP